MGLFASRATALQVASQTYRQAREDAPDFKGTSHYLLRSVTCLTWEYAQSEGTTHICTDSTAAYGGTIQTCQLCNVVWHLSSLVTHIRRFA